MELFIRYKYMHNIYLYTYIPIYLYLIPTTSLTSY